MREVSRELSNYLVKLLHEELRRRKLTARKYSQNKMARDIGIPGGSLSSVMAAKKGIGDELLPKILVFLRKTREEAEDEALGGSVSSKDRAVSGRLSRVRDSLYSRHARTIVDRVIMTSEYLDGVSDEIAAVDALEARIRQIEKPSSPGDTARRLVKAGESFAEHMRDPEIGRESANE